jgi:hypothetical protein
VDLAFSWSSITNYQYRILIATDPAFTAVLTNRDLGATASYSFPVPPALREADTVFYWRVEGVILGTNTNLSPLRAVITTTNAAATAPRALRDLVISEVNWSGIRNDSGEADADGEFIEIRNTRSFRIDLGGMRLIYTNETGTVTKTHVFEPYTILPAWGFFVVGVGGATSDDNPGDFEDFDRAYDLAAFQNIYQSSIDSLANNGISLHLYAADGTTLLDGVNARGLGYEGFKILGSSLTPKKTMERKNPPGDGNLAANWSAAAYTGLYVKDGYQSGTWATPGQTNSIW